VGMVASDLRMGLDAHPCVLHALNKLVTTLKFETSSRIVLDLDMTLSPLRHNSPLEYHHSSSRPPSYYG